MNFVYFLAFSFVNFHASSGRELSPHKVIQGKLGDPIQISYLSSNRHQLINYCVWTPPSTISKHKGVPFITFQPFNECGVSLKDVEPDDFGDWNFIAIFKSSGKQNGQNPPVIEGTITLKPYPPVFFLLKPGVSPSPTSPIPWLIESSNNILSMTGKEANITCCLENFFQIPPILQFYFDEKVIGGRQHHSFTTPHRTCIRWKYQINWRDNSKVISCKANDGPMDELGLKSLPQQVSAQLNITFSPKIIVDGVLADCERKLKVESPKETQVGIQFQSNPAASAKWKRVLPVQKDRKHPHSQVTELKPEEFSTQLIESSPNIMESRITFLEIGKLLKEAPTLELRLTISNSYGKCQLYLTVSSSPVKVPPGTHPVRGSDDRKGGVDKPPEVSSQEPSFSAAFPSSSEFRSTSTTRIPSPGEIRPLPVLRDNQSTFSEGSRIRKECCIQLEPNTELSFQLDKSPLQTNSRGPISNETHICYELNFEAKWTDNEKLLRCRKVVNKDPAREEASLLLFVKHKPVPLPPIPTSIYGEEAELIILYAANPKPTARWHLQTHENENCISLERNGEKYGKSFYNFSLKLTSELSDKCGSSIRVGLEVTNEQGKSLVWAHWELKSKNGERSTSGALRFMPLHIILFNILIPVSTLGIRMLFHLIKNHPHINCS